MDDQRDKLWNAYLDGELPASEAAAFDQSLTPDDRKRLEGELAFERACAEALRKETACPDPVWQRTLEALPENGTLTRRTPPRYWKPIAALAAAVLVTISVFAVRVNTASPTFLELPELNVTTLQEANALERTSLADVNAFLQDRNLDVALMPVKAGHHPVRLLGARKSTFHDEEVVELLFSCCDKPMKIVLAPQGGRAAEAIGKALGGGLVRFSRPVGTQVAAQVGRHTSPGILANLTEDWDIKTSVMARD